MMLLAIINGKVLDGAGHTWDKATVLAENGKIKAVGPDVAVPEGAQVIDAEGCWVTPGFVEPHTHISLMGEPQTRGGISDVNESIDPVTAQIRAIDAFDPCNMSVNWARRGGFTTCCVLPGSANVIGGEGFVFKTAPKATVDEMEVPGTRVMKFALGAQITVIKTKSRPAWVQPPCCARRFSTPASIPTRCALRKRIRLPCPSATSSLKRWYPWYAAR